MNILITGSTGFIGQELVETLEYNSDLQLYLLSRKKNFILNSNCKAIYLDLTKDYEYNFLKDIDVVIHLAAKQHLRNNKNKDFYRDVNIDATRRLVNFSVKYSVKKFIYLSTVQVNGELSSREIYINENSELAASTGYAKSKLEAEKIIKDVCGKSNTKYVIVRSPLVYGKNAKGNIQSLEKAIYHKIPLPLAKINNKRSNISIFNLNSFIQYSIFSSEVDNETFLVSDNEDISTSEFVEKIIHYSGHKILFFKISKWLLFLLFFVIGRRDIYYKLTNNYCISIAKVLKKTSWRPVCNLDESMKKIYQ